MDLHVCCQKSTGSATFWIKINVRLYYVSTSDVPLFVWKVGCFKHNVTHAD